MKRWIAPLLALLVVAALFAAHRSLDLSLLRDFERLRSLVAAQGTLAPVVFVAACVAAVFLHVPELVVIALGGVLFGPARGFLLGWLGALAGATLTFLIARTLLRDAARRHLLTRLEALRGLDDHLGRHGLVTVLGLRLVLFMFPPLNWALGASRLSVRDYLGGTALGLVPGTIVTVWLADSLAASGGSVRDLFRPGVLVPAALIVGFLATSALAARRLLGGAGSGPR